MKARHSRTRKTRLQLKVNPGLEVYRLRPATAHELATGNHHNGQAMATRVLTRHGAFTREPGQILLNRGFDYAGYQAEQKRIAEQEAMKRPGQGLLTRMGSKLAGKFSIRPKVKLRAPVGAHG